jgi:hypothetical protein
MKKRLYISILSLALAFACFATGDTELGQNYPNPAKGKTFIEVQFSSPQATLTIYNVLGKQVDFLQIEHSGKFVINVADLPDGVYMYTLDADGKKITKRMTVKK